MLDSPLVVATLSNVNDLYLRRILPAASATALPFPIESADNIL
jgi:hypothetical protein